MPQPKLTRRRPRVASPPPEIQTDPKHIAGNGRPAVPAHLTPGMADKNDKVHRAKTSKGALRSSRPPRRTIPDQIDVGLDDEQNGHRSIGDAYQAYVRHIGKIRVLTRAEERELGRRIRVDQDPDARELLIRHNLRLVIWVARMYFYRFHRMEFMDLVQIGNIGLMRAVNMFDERREIKFSTYATWWILSAITRSPIDLDPLVHVPVHAKERVMCVVRATRLYTQKTGRPPQPDELAVILNRPVQKIVDDLRTLSRSRGITSLDAPSAGIQQGQLTKPLIDMTPDPQDHNPAADPLIGEAMATGFRILRRIETVLPYCSARDQQVFRLRYGLDGTGDAKTLQVIGQQMGITRERVRQIIIAMWKRMARRGLKRQACEPLLRPLGEILAERNGIKS